MARDSKKRSADKFTYGKDDLIDIHVGPDHDMIVRTHADVAAFARGETWKGYRPGSAPREDSPAS